MKKEWKNEEGKKPNKIKILAASGILSFVG